MLQVNTVPGPMDSSEMGFTLTHEHISSGAAAAYPGFQDRRAIADAATAAVADAYAGGVCTIIDVTTFDRGREVDGGKHQEQKQYDEAGTSWLESEGFAELRFWNNDVPANQAVLVEVVALPRQGRWNNDREVHREYRFFPL